MIFQFFFKKNSKNGLNNSLKSSQHYGGYCQAILKKLFGLPDNTDALVG